jgi:hypothetical protein
MRYIPSRGVQAAAEIIFRRRHSNNAKIQISDLFAFDMGDQETGTINKRLAPNTPNIVWWSPTGLAVFPANGSSCTWVRFLCQNPNSPNWRLSWRLDWPVSLRYLKMIPDLRDWRLKRLNRPRKMRFMRLPMYYSMASSGLKKRFTIGNHRFSPTARYDLTNTYFEGNCLDNTFSSLSVVLWRKNMCRNSRPPKRRLSGLPSRRRNPFISRKSRSWNGLDD